MHASVAALGVLFASVSFLAAQTPDTLSNFKTFFRNAVQKKGIVGASVRVIHGGDVVASESFGMAHVAEARPVDENTIFHWASITKTFTGIAIMQLRDRGLLQLDDPIVKYVPELRGVHNPYGSMDGVTLRHLMSHSAGFRAGTWPWGGDKPWHPMEPLHWEQFLAMIPYTEILFPPGSRYSYSNPGIILLGRVIEMLTTDDYEVYVDKNILRPLEMDRAYFDSTPYHLKRDRAQSYYLKDGVTAPARFDPNSGITVSNSGLNAPLPDMVKYVRFLMGGGGSGLVLSRASLDEMWRPQVPIDDRSSMGLTFFVEERAGRRLIAHGGDQDGFISHFYLDRDSDTAYVVAFNTDDGDGLKVLDEEIRDYILENVFPLYAAAPAPTEFDLLIKNGTVVDGSGAKGAVGDVGIKDGKIQRVGRLSGARAAAEIDATGKIVAPGFIDVHTHADDLAEHPLASNFVRMGVTAVVAGNCGGSAANLAEALSGIEKAGASLNFATLYGHNTARREIMGTEKRAPTPDELARMKALVAKAMDDGAVGFSTGLQYVPGTYSDVSEIIELARVAGARGGIYASHMRNEGTTIDAAIAEALAVGEACACPVEISHLKIDSKSHWGGADRILETLADARRRGIEARADQYAYTAGSSTLGIRFPSWVLEGGAARINSRLDDPATWQKIKEEMKGLLSERGFPDLSWAFVASYAADPSRNGSSLDQVAERVRGAASLDDQLETAREMLRAGGASMVYHFMSEEDVKKIMRDAEVSVASDADLLTPGEGVPHPRGYGNNPRVLGRYVRELSVLPLEEAIRKMTSLPARHFRFRDRGAIDEGYWADLVIFDPKTVGDPATFAEPHQYASGIEHVLVNGVFVVRDGKHTGARPGHVIRGEPSAHLPLGVGPQRPIQVK